jgi:2-oxo-4-hydroxy-4-carboxy-5-ureidoimidazoline decarboxylase
MTLDEANALDTIGFVVRFGDVAEHSPWVAEEASVRRPFADREAMVAAFSEAIALASPEKQRALLNAHPDLAGRAAIAGELAAESRREQAGAGLDQLSPREFSEFTRLNEDYRARNGFPFILAVKGAAKDVILAAFRDRIRNPPSIEFGEAIRQVQRIVRFRLEERIG